MILQKAYQICWAYARDPYQTDNCKVSTFSYDTYEEAIKQILETRNYWNDSPEYLYWIEKDKVKLFAPCIKSSIPRSEPYNYQSDTYLFEKGETTMAAATKVFDFTTVLHAEPKKDNSGNDVTEDSQILEVGRIVAKDEEHVKRVAARSDKLKHLTDKEIGRLEIKVKPF